MFSFKRKELSHALKPIISTLRDLDEGTLRFTSPAKSLDKMQQNLEDVVFNLQDRQIQRAIHWGLSGALMIAVYGLTVFVLPPVAVVVPIGILFAGTIAGMGKYVANAMAVQRQGQIIEEKIISVMQGKTGVKISVRGNFNSKAAVQERFDTLADQILHRPRLHIVGQRA